jgi:colicin import membrane protein
MSERPSDRWVSTALSVLLHGGLIALLAFGWWNFKKAPKPEPPLPAIDALVVDSKSLAAIPAARTPTPPPPQPEPEPEPEPEPPPEPPKPTPEEVAQQERVEEEKRQEEQRIVEERQQAERAEAERKEREDAEAKKRAEEERVAEQKKQQEEAKRQAEEKRKREEARLEAERQAELRRSMEEEERVMAARSSGAMASWIQAIQARIQRAWIRPPSARAGIDCVLNVTQIPGGEVTSVSVGQCNGDEAVRESIEAAAYRASPLPPPPDPALFERNLEIRFRPVD